MAQKKDPQIDRILAWFEKGKTLTPLQALVKFGTMRLAAYVYELKKRGWTIETEMIRVGKEKKMVARYRLGTRPTWAW